MLLHQCSKLQETKTKTKTRRQKRKAGLSQVSYSHVLVAENYVTNQLSVPGKAEESDDSDSEKEEKSKKKKGKGKKKKVINHLQNHISC